MKALMSLLRTRSFRMVLFASFVLGPAWAYLSQSLPFAVRVVLALAMGAILGVGWTYLDFKKSKPKPPPLNEDHPNWSDYQ